MHGRSIHCHGTRTKPAWCAILTGAALTRAYVNRSPEGLEAWCPTDNTYSLRSLRSTHAESTRSAELQTICWTQGSYCAVMKMVFQGISVVRWTPGMKCPSTPEHACARGRRERKKPFQDGTHSRHAQSAKAAKPADQCFAADSPGKLAEADGCAPPADSHWCQLDANRNP